MPSYLQPGVYIKEISSGSRPIAAAGTSTAVFIGYMEKGPVGDPILITGWAQYETEFGGLLDTQRSVSGSLFSSGDATGLAVYAFFQNGGTRAYICRVGGGDSGSVPSVNEYDNIFQTLLNIRDINIVLLPGQAWDADGKPIIESAIAHCEVMKNRMVIFDLPPGSELISERDVQLLNLTSSSYAAVYYPWPVVRNRFYNLNSGPGVAESLLVSPAAFAAGIWAKTDSRRGVWRAPAGAQSALLGVSQLEYAVEGAQQDFLNPHGINPLRHLRKLGSVLWGSRTCSVRADPQWRYLPVKRTAMFIEESLYRGTQWVAFEGNDQRLWSSLRATVESFMDGLFLQGAFQGSKASEAYFVRCGQGQTMTQSDIDRGQVILQVGFAPLKPAEFVILHIQQKTQRQ